MQIDNRILPSAKEAIFKAIEEAEGNEVLCLGKTDNEGTVAEIRVAARGNKGAVPAVMGKAVGGDIIIHNHPSGDLTPSDADLATAGSISNRGCGFYIVDNQVTRIYVICEAVEKEELQPIDIDKAAAILEPGGNLEANTSHYEPRNSQINFLRTISESFNNSKICVAEAGTGVGKSFAYLIPSFAWVARNKERVVISTATINLQEQLLNKDIPMVSTITGYKLKAVLVKGRRNYLCLQKLKELEDEYGLFQEEQEELRKIGEWAENTETGSRSDMAFYPNPNTWSRISSEADSCLGIRCPFREKCFVLKARREAASAHILIVNHHLLFSDLAVKSENQGMEGSAVLPPYQRIVFDEAHNIERSATSFFSSILSRFSTAKQTSRLYQRRRGKTIGLAVKLQRSYPAHKNLFSELPQDIQAITEQAEALEHLFSDWMESNSTFRITEQLNSKNISVMKESFGELETRIAVMVEHAWRHVEKNFTEEDEEDTDLFQFKAVLRRMEEFSKICSLFRCFEEHSDKVFWVEKATAGKGQLFLKFTITPLDISNLMREAVFTPYGTVVCTSATLAVAGSFRYWCKRVGLLGFSEEDLITQIFPSPFPYSTNALLGIPNDGPPPDSEAYQDYISKSVRNILLMSDGRGLVLFTSYSMLQNTYDDIVDELHPEGIHIYRQGEDERTRLLKGFIEDTKSVLFATESFWQGVDVPGEALGIVIICRLPFSVPTAPVLKARMEAIKKADGNPFMELSLPEAVMKLKQGFGRLIRRHTDRGVVIILDNRIITKRYGSLFLKSLPNTRRVVGDSNNVLSDIENFLY